MVGGVRLMDIRAHEGSQARGWEELTFQLRVKAKDGLVETRKTRAPDGGVEWYDVYEDGHEEGFQAKFNSCLADALGGMTESVKAVAAKRPAMTRLTFYVPYDFTDTGNDSRKSDQDRWEDKITSWRRDISGANRLDFAVVRGGEVTDVLTQAEHVGRRAYWFGSLELSDDWFNKRWEEARAVAGPRYTPDADSPSAVNGIIDAVACSRSYRSSIQREVQEAVRACRTQTSLWTDGVQAATVLERLEEHAQQLSDSELAGSLVANLEPDFQSMRDLSAEVLALGVQLAAANGGRERASAEAAMSSMRQVEALASTTQAHVATERLVAIQGEAGQGKTHALLRGVRKLLDDGAPALVIMGERIGDINWWAALAQVLGGVPGTSDDFLAALDSLAEARGTRALIAVDALNESRNPGNWRSELPSFAAAVRQHDNLALLVSCRSDYEEVVFSGDLMRKVRHPGIAGFETQALAKYCQLFGVSIPVASYLDQAFASPLFLRIYCEILAADPSQQRSRPGRSDLFVQFALLRLLRVRSRLHLPPTSPIPQRALEILADRLIADRGEPVSRALVEEEVDALLPGRAWPNSLFQVMVSEGLFELRPQFDSSDEVVTFPFQAYSEHLVATRMISIEAAKLAYPPGPKMIPGSLSDRLEDARWLWRAMAVLLPERYGLELVDLLPKHASHPRMSRATLRSFVDRRGDSFSDRALQLLQQDLDLSDPSVREVVLELAVRPQHGANVDWLTERLLSMTMAERDASWTVAMFELEDDSSFFRRLLSWMDDGGSQDSSPDQVRLVATLLTWQFTSSNRFLRDHVSKLLVQLLSAHLDACVALIRLGRLVDDAYVSQRVALCVYGALVVGGGDEAVAAGRVMDALLEWDSSGLPVDVLTRDAVQGAFAWARSRGLLPRTEDRIRPPLYGASPPEEPPTAEQLEEQHGPVRDASSEVSQWRGQSILSSCLEWYGDFHKYVVAGDVGYFSWYPLDGPRPPDDYSDPLGKVDAKWAGRWIAARAFELGWEAGLFEEFERYAGTRSGREAHKAERIGKKYQWIALHELLARLADNYHPRFEGWAEQPQDFVGPWAWYGRDLDPTLPPSVPRRDGRVCVLRQHPVDGVWLTPVDRGVPASPDEWVQEVLGLPDAESMFFPKDSQGKRWVALYRYASWSREGSARPGLSKRDRGVFFLQFSWLVPREQGDRLFAVLGDAGLSGRWMSDLEIKRPHGQFLGEGAWAPIDLGRKVDREIPSRLSKTGLTDVRATTEQWLWEGGTIDCSLDESVEVNAPTSELLGDASWCPYSSSWRLGEAVVARYISDGSESEQSVCLVDEEWLKGRLGALDVDLVMGTLSEKHASPPEDDDYRKMAYADVLYRASMSVEGEQRVTGPQVSVRRLLSSDGEA